MYFKSARWTSGHNALCHFSPHRLWLTLPPKERSAHSTDCLTAKRTAVVAMLLLSRHALPGNYKCLKFDINRVANFQVTGVVTEEKIFITMQN